MFLLGIQSYANNDSGACILKFDKKKNKTEYVAISEERLLRKKHPYTFPIHSINYCLDYFKLKDLKKIDYIKNEINSVTLVKRDKQRAFARYIERRSSESSFFKKEYQKVN